MEKIVENRLKNKNNNILNSYKFLKKLREHEFFDDSNDDPKRNFSTLGLPE